MKNRIGATTTIGVIGLLLSGCLSSQPSSNSPATIQVTLQFVDVDDAAMPVMRLGKGFSAADLDPLLAQGKARLVATMSVATRSGHEAVIKGVTELIYPTRFSAVSSEPAEKQTSVSVAVGGAVEPGDFQTREIGLIFQVVPEMAGEKTIQVTLNPQSCSGPQWINYGTSDALAITTNELGASCFQPLVDVFTVSTSVVVQDGQSIMLGICPRRHVPNMTTVALLTASRVR